MTISNRTDIDYTVTTSIGTHFIKVLTSTLIVSFFHTNYIITIECCRYKAVWLVCTLYNPIIAITVYDKMMGDCVTHVSFTPRFGDNLINSLVSIMFSLVDCCWCFYMGIWKLSHIFLPQGINVCIKFWKSLQPILYLGNVD